MELVEVLHLAVQADVRTLTFDPDADYMDGPRTGLHSYAQKVRALCLSGFYEVIEIVKHPREIMRHWLHRIIKMQPFALQLEIRTRL